MDDVDATHGKGESVPQRGVTAALEYVADPVFTVEDGTIIYANERAKNALELPGDVIGTEASNALEPIWSNLETEIAETTIGTVRNVDIDVEAFDARVHRGHDGATVTLHSHDDETEFEDVDRAVKTRAINEAPVGFSLSDPHMEDNPLVYVNSAYEELTGYPGDEVVGRNCRLLQGPESDAAATDEMRAAIDEERPTTVEIKNYRKDGTEFWNEVTVAPVRNSAGEITHYVGFQNDITQRKETQFALQERTDELEYILERVEGLIQDVTTAVAGSISRSALEQSVCERIAAESPYEGAWVGERNPATDVLEVRATAGVDPEDVPVDADHPSAVSLETESVVVETYGGMTQAAFPLEYNGVEYGTLTVCSDQNHEVTDREEVILSALARAVASGINARETSRMLATDAVVAVELDLTDPALVPVALTTETDCQLEYRRSVHRTGDDTASLFTATGIATEDLQRVASTLEDADLEVLVEREDSCLIEFHSDDDFVRWLSERGILVQSIEADSGRARVTLEIPHSTNVRGVVEAVQSKYDGTDVVSFRQHERGGDTQEEFAASLEGKLTERQFASLQRAYLGGYFEWPRPTTGEELAQSMGVSRPTFHEHLRSAEAKLCQAFFDDEPDSR
ncbi:bacterio-opsin activator domain-containing protein [Natrialbaceae archaeon A-chndr2]